MQRYQHIIIAVVVIVLIGLFAWPLLRGEPTTDGPPADLTEDEAIELAMDWVRTEAPTYVFDGSNLTFDRIETIPDCDNCFEVTVSFESAAAGFGDRTDQMVAQVITPHTTVVSIEGGEVIRAVTDGEFVEYEREEVIEPEEPEPTEVNDTPATTPTTPETRTISVFFSNSQEDPDMLYCDRVYSVERTVDNVPAIARAAINELLAGPTAADSQAGYFTNINEGTQLQDIVIDDGVAYVDFNQRLNEAVGGSCLVTAIRAQITDTVSQFPTVNEVVISVDGDSEEILQP